MRVSLLQGITTDTSGVAVTIDLGGASNWGDDHPPNKNEMPSSDSPRDIMLFRGDRLIRTMAITASSAKRMISVIVVVGASSLDLP